ncbi:Hypothetical protein, putative [Bodo saltans]|uniref:Uncharacterized protein n=1 Tax=Bodo saltans TaxID=75058 RepID=A0A0S4IPY7_BODSA|nr:Hypothetical protein, putative [Bodo saltans]|eukprot:CUE77289.1 Hypothetical protein, putative [Bodo saltans]
MFRTNASSIREEYYLVEHDANAKRRECEELEHNNAMQREANIKSAGLEGLAKQLHAKEAELVETEQRIAKMLQKPGGGGAEASQPVTSSTATAAGNEVASDASPSLQDTLSASPSFSVAVAAATTGTSLDEISDLTKDQYESLKQKKIANANAIANLTNTVKTIGTEYVPPASYSSWHDKKMVDQQNELLVQKKALLVKIRQREESILDNCDPKREQARPASFCSPLVGTAEGCDNGGSGGGVEVLPLVDDNVVATLQPSAVPARRRSSVGAAILTSPSEAAPPTKSVKQANNDESTPKQTMLSHQILPPASREGLTPPTQPAAGAVDSNELSVPKAGRRSHNNSAAATTTTLTASSSTTTTEVAPPHSATTNSTVTVTTEHSPRSEATGRVLSPMVPPASHNSNGSLSTATASDASPVGPRNGRRANNNNSVGRGDDATSRPTNETHGGPTKAATKQQKEAEEALLASILNGPPSTSTAPVAVKESNALPDDSQANSEPSWL